MSGAPEVSWTEVVRVLAAAHGLTDPMDNDAVECVLWNETPYPVGSVKDVVRSLNDLFEFLASPEPRGEHGGRSTCPQCGRRWWVTPLDDCLVPACGCYGTDTGADNPERPCHRCGLAHATSCEHMPARSARPQPTEGTTPAELVQVGWGGCVGHSTCEVDEGHEWYLRHLDDKHELDRTHPIWPVYALRAVPGAVAGEPEARWCAHQRDGWCAVVPDVEPAEGSSVDTACGFHIPLPGGFDHRTLTCPDCLAALRAGEPESTPAAEPRCTCETWRRCAIATGASDAAALRWTCPTHGEQRHPRAADTQEAHDA